MPKRKLLCLLIIAAGSLPAQQWIAAADEAAVKRTGAWSVDEFRRASTVHLLTTEDGAALELAFHGTGLVLTLDAHGVSYARLGLENLGSLEVTVDGRSGAAVLQIGRAHV